MNAQKKNDCDRFAPLVVAYVTGALDGAEADSFEGHVASCLPCGRLLMQESQLELRLHEVGLHVARQPPRRDAFASPGHAPARAKRAVLAAAAAMTMALALYAARSERLREGDTAGTSVRGQERFAVTCLDAAGVAHCRDEADRHGVRIEYPPALAGIPRYEDMAPAYGAGLLPARRALLPFD